MFSRHVAAAVWLLTAVLVQLGILNRAHLPLGGPNIALLSVLALGLLEGPAVGMAFGFAVGLLGDVTGTHTIGRLALVWTVAGFAAGLFATADRRDTRNPTVPMLVVGVGTLLSCLVYAALAVVVGDPHAPVATLIRTSAGAAVFNVVLTPFLFLPLRGLLARLDVSRA